MPFVNIEGTKIHFAADPSPLEPRQTTLLLIHGAGGSHEIWSHQLESLNCEYNVVAPDLPGHGLSKGNAEQDISYYSDWINRFIKTLGKAPLIVVGHSMGGAIAIEVCRRPPRHLVGAVFMGTGAKLKVSPEMFKRLEENRHAFKEFVSRHAFSSKTSMEVKEDYFSIARKTDPEIILSDYRACDSFEGMDALKSISVQSLILVGSDDQMTPPKYSQHLNENLLNSRLEIIPDAGHMLMLEQPAELNRKLEEFILEIMSS